MFRRGQRRGLNRRGIGVQSGGGGLVTVLTAPTAGTFYRTLGYTVSATASGPAPDRIDWVLDPGGGETIIATDATDPYSQTWTVGVAEVLGAHTLVARAVRGAESTESAPINITVASHPSEFGTLEGWIDPRYNNTNSGDGTAVTAWVSKDAGAFAATIVGAPTYEATGWNGQPSVVGDGVGDGAHWSGTLGSFPSGSDTPFQIVCAAQVLSATTGKCLLAFCSSANNSIFAKLETLSSNRYLFMRRDDALAQKTAASAVNDLVLTRTRLSLLFPGTTVSLYKNTALTGINGTGDLDVGTTTLNRFALFMQRGVANIGFCNVRFGPVLVYSTLTDRAGAEAWLSSEGYA